MRQLLKKFPDSIKIQLNDWLSRPSHALLLHGDNYSEIISVVSSELKNHFGDTSRVINFGGIDTPASISDIRSVVSLATRKSNSAATIVVIESIDQISIEAQNTLLKTIEEPPEGLVVVMGAANIRLVLETIISRAVCIQSGDLFEDEVSKSQKLTYARSFLKASPEERLRISKELSSDKLKLQSLIDALVETISFLIHKQSDRRNLSQIKTLLSKQEMLIELKQDLSDNVSPKAISSYLCTSL